MGNLFDGYAQQLFNTVSKTMGDDAQWIPSDGSAPSGLTARVLFSNPTKANKINSDVEYNPFDWQIEYHHNSFTGLKESVDTGNAETITINGDEYYVKSVITKWDGDLSMAKLEKK